GTSPRFVRSSAPRRPSSRRGRRRRGGSFTAPTATRRTRSSPTSSRARPVHGLIRSHRETRGGSDLERQRRPRLRRRLHRLWVQTTHQAREAIGWRPMRAATIERNGVVLEQWQWDALDVELPRKLRHAATGPFVYFAQEVDGEAIKIGTASEPWARLVGLQTGNPRKLEIRQLVVGGAPVETRFHRLW